jgi:hypothetical protein
MRCTNCGNAERFTKVMAIRCNDCQNEHPITDHDLLNLIKELMTITECGTGCGDWSRTQRVYANAFNLIPEQYWGDNKYMDRFKKSIETKNRIRA